MVGVVVALLGVLELGAWRSVSGWTWVVWVWPTLMVRTNLVLCVLDRWLCLVVTVLLKLTVGWWASRAALRGMNLCVIIVPSIVIILGLISWLKLPSIS